MFFSLYPTDTDAVRAAVVEQVIATSERTVFTSLHIPESDDLRRFGAYLAALHREHGIVFWADVSPAMLDKLGITLDEAGLLAEWGVVGVRIDYGFAPDEVRRLAEAGPFRVAVNASTATAAMLDDLAAVRPVGWHNYYPRPETGITSDFYVAQNRLFTERGLDIVSFVPGETTFRAPLHLGLPTIESHRGRPSYVAALELRSLCPDTALCCAEGALLPDHLDWIAEYEASGTITLPLVAVDAAAEFLLDRTWTVRPEQTGVSQRLEGTRGSAVPTRVRNADRRATGSIQMDLPLYGRYAGEVHVMGSDRPLDPGQARVADIAAPYVALAQMLSGRDRVRFVRWDA